MGKHWLVIFGITPRQDQEREARTAEAEANAKRKQAELQIEIDRAKTLNELFAKVASHGD